MKRVWVKKCAHFVYYTLLLLHVAKFWKTEVITFQCVDRDFSSCTFVRGHAYLTVASETHIRFSVYLKPLLYFKDARVTKKLSIIPCILLLTLLGK